MALTLQITTLTDPMFGQNAYVVVEPASAELWVIDPGLQVDRVIRAVEAHVRESGGRLSRIVNTHGHVDHIAGNRDLHALHPDTPIAAPAAEAHFLTDPEANLSARYGFPVVSPAATELLRAGDVLALGELRFSVLDVSGHSPGGLALYCAAEQVCFVGDSIMAGSMGRCDLPGGSEQRLVRNVREQILSLPGSTRLLSGHGPETTVQRELGTNPYFAVRVG